MVNGGMESGSLVRIWDKAAPVPNVVATFGLQELGAGLVRRRLRRPGSDLRPSGRPLADDRDGPDGALCSISPGPVTRSAADGTTTRSACLPSWDYAKPAVWATDANGGSGSYVITGNDEDPPVFILNREAMLAGDAAILQTVHLPSMPNAIRFQASTPADADGASAPPAGGTGDHHAAA